MKMCRKSKFAKLMVSSLATLAMLLMLFGCSGGDGAAGPQGPQGPQGTPGLNASQVPVNLASLAPEVLDTLQMTATVSSITIQSPLTVTFTVKNKENGQPLTGMDANLRFALAKLVPGTNGSPDRWVSYLVTETSRPTTESNGILTANADGSYTYAFAKDIKDVTKTGGVTFEPNLTHRLTIQCSGSIAGTTETVYNPMNYIYDFIPGADGIGKPITATDAQREIVTIEACNECHGKLAMHGGGRTETKYCVVCHTDQRKNGRTASTSTAGAFAPIVKDPVTGATTSASTYVADGEVSGNFVTMIHKIHMGNKLTKQNYYYAGVAFNTIGYPQDQTNCRKCHKGDTPAQLAAAPQANNWKTKPSRLACGACHDNVDFATGTNHVGGAKADDAFCALCHDTLDIETKHTTPNATPNNPSVPAGAVNFTYEVSSLTVNASNQAVVKFRILKDGTAVTFDGGGSAPLTGFTGSPSFLLAFADGTDTTVDYNNKGNAAAQPVSVSIATLLDGTRGTLGAPDASGYYTATIGTGTYTAANFPAGAKVRAVALQGYFTQAAGTNGIAAATARHTVAAWKGATGDTVRREVIDSEKCAKCHEWFEGHGGNRVKTVAVCVMCHNPNLTSSGRGVTVTATAPAQAERDKLTAAGYTATDPLTFPEASNNFKDMIHGIHASHARTTKFDFVRDRNGGLYYDWSHVAFPGVLKSCETCHKAGTYGVNNIPASALWTTTRISDGTDATPAAVKLARNQVNATDRVTSPITATCIACHDGAVAIAHIDANGGQRNVARGGATNTEQCLLCHGPNKVADVAVMHKK